MNRSTPGLPVHHQLPESTQTHVHCVSDAIQPSHPLSSPSPPAFNLSQHQGLFHWVSSSHQVAKVLELQFQQQSFQWMFRGDFLELTGLISLLSKGLSRVFSNITVQKHRFFSVQPSLWSNTHTHTWLLEKPCLWLYGPLLVKQCLCYTRHKNQEKEDWSVPGNQNYTCKGPFSKLRIVLACLNETLQGYERTWTKWILSINTCMFKNWVTLRVWNYLEVNRELSQLLSRGETGSDSSF